MLFLSCEKSHESRLKVDSETFIGRIDSKLLKQFKKCENLYRSNEYTLALESALNLLERAQENKEERLIPYINYLIGKIWYETKSYKKSISFFRRSLDGFAGIIKLKDSSNFTDNNREYSNDYQYIENNYRIGKSYNELYQKFGEKDSIQGLIYKDSTLYFYNKAINVPFLSKEIELLKSKIYNNLSGLYAQDKFFDEAEEYTLKSLDIKHKYGDQYSKAVAYSTLSTIHFYKEEYEESKNALNKGLDALEKIKGERADQIKADLYYNLAYSMYKLEDYKAYEFQEKAYVIYDSINELDKARDLTRITQEKNFELGKIVGIQQEQIKKQNAQKTAWIIGVGSCFVIVSLVLILKQYKLRQKYLSLELSQQELEQQQHIEKLKNESQIRILNATLDGKESERKQIAETLHDSVSTMLSSAHRHLEARKSQFNGSTPVEVDKSQTIIDEAAKKIRDLSHTLVSSILLKFGLEFAIKDIAEKFSNSELTIDHDARYMRRYDLGFEIKLYNIAQEFLNNVLKHSKAKAAKIVLVEKNRKVILVVEDNGRGFEEKNTQQKDGIGISQIKARIQMMGGKLDIESKPGKGTKVTVQLPIVERVVINV